MIGITRVQLFKEDYMIIDRMRNAMQHAKQASKELE